MPRRAKRQTIAEIMREGTAYLTIDERLAALERVVLLLVKKHHGLTRTFDRRSARHDDLIEALILDTVDLQAHVIGPEPEKENHPYLQALRCKHLGKPKKPARRSAENVDLAAHRRNQGSLRPTYICRYMRL